jgi:hypothetical protein
VTEHRPHLQVHIRTGVGFFIYRNIDHAPEKGPQKKQKDLTAGKSQLGKGYGYGPNLDKAEDKQDKEKKDNKNQNKERQEKKGIGRHRPSFRACQDTGFWHGLKTQGRPRQINLG